MMVWFVLADSHDIKEGLKHRYFVLVTVRKFSDGIQSQAACSLKVSFVSPKILKSQLGLEKM